jgi:hypothetical protein
MFGAGLRLAHFPLASFVRALVLLSFALSLARPFAFVFPFHLSSSCVLGTGASCGVGWVWTVAWLSPPVFGACSPWCLALQCTHVTPTTIWGNCKIIYTHIYIYIYIRVTYDGSSSEVGLQVREQCSLHRCQGSMLLTWDASRYRDGHPGITQSLGIVNLGHPSETNVVMGSTPKKLLGMGTVGMCRSQPITLFVQSVALLFQQAPHGYTSMELRGQIMESVAFLATKVMCLASLHAQPDSSRWCSPGGQLVTSHRMAHTIKPYTVHYLVKHTPSSSPFSTIASRTCQTLCQRKSQRKNQRKGQPR